MNYLAHGKNKNTYNAKEFYHICARNGIACGDFAFDLMLGAFLLDSSLTSYEAFSTTIRSDAGIDRRCVWQAGEEHPAGI